jgi:hypothetical protein
MPSKASLSAGEMKRVVKLLKLAARILSKHRWVTAIHVRAHAKVPIVNLSTPFGVEVDLGVGGATGVDTSDYSSSLAARFPDAFSPTVLALKALLRQWDLDKPFTGGLGSFKLYVMVAAHFEARLAAGAAVAGADLADLLAGFFGRYESKRAMNQGTVIEAMGGTADFSGTFKVRPGKHFGRGGGGRPNSLPLFAPRPQVNEIRSMFAWAGKELSKKKARSPSGPCVGAFLDEAQLAADRANFQRLADKAVETDLLGTKARARAEEARLAGPRCGCERPPPLPPELSRPSIMHNYYHHSIGLRNPACGDCSQSVI